MPVKLQPLLNSLNVYGNRLGYERMLKVQIWNPSKGPHSSSFYFAFKNVNAKMAVSGKDPYALLYRNGNPVRQS